MRDLLRSLRLRGVLLLDVFMTSYNDNDRSRGEEAMILDNTITPFYHLVSWSISPRGVWRMLPDGV